MHAEEIIFKLKNDCGLDVYRADMPSEMPDSGIFEDFASDRTVIAVGIGSKYALAIDGVGKDRRVIAALVRDLATGYAVKRPDDPMRDFLDGVSGESPIRVGKSDYYVFAIYCENRQNSVREYLGAMAGHDDFIADMTDSITAFCKKSDPGDDYQSAGEFAVVLHENLCEEIEENIKIGVGGVAHGVSELPLYYSYAKTSLASGAEFDPNSDIYSYKEYALIKILSALPRTATESYVRTVLDKNFKTLLADNELMTAADSFIKNSLNISLASRSMYVHRNTLIYRLDKIEKMTGLNIRNFNDAMSFRIAYLIYKSLK